MEQAIPITLNAVNMGAQHFDKVYDPVKKKYWERKGYYQEDPDIKDHRTPEEKGLVLRRRKDVGSDEEIVETVRHRGEILSRRPGRPRQIARRSSSYDDLRDAGKKAAAGGAAAGAMVPYRDSKRGDKYGTNASDSEGSVPPRSRVRAKSVSGRSHASRRNRGTSSSSDTSSLCSSTEDEKNVRKIQRKKWITGAFATVATIHAATKVYGSIESHDKRIRDVALGKMSPEEAHKKQKTARWQDAAAIGIAALGIRGAMSEWHEVNEEHHQHKELMEKKDLHHQKRLEAERRRRARERGGYYKGRDGEWYYDGPMPQSSDSKRGREQYDDRRAIDDSNRERRMLDYEEAGTNGSKASYNRSAYEKDYHRDKSRSGKDRDRDRSRNHRRDDDYSDTRSSHSRHHDRDHPLRNSIHTYDRTQDKNMDSREARRKFEKPEKTAGQLGAGVVDDLIT